MSAREDRINMIRRMLEQTPEDLFLNYALGLEYVKIGDDKQALKQFDLVLEYDRSYLAVYYQKGNLLERLGRYEQALQVYEHGAALAVQQNEPKTASELRTAHEHLEDLIDEEE